ncbi:hypothetical protein AURDEDRAFT_172628 [Auricularia subglabra TFB-10046 SS5]|nr:hypothetical protein AURDEDRAFT_172628 [Auricularia subglabra TFB-10046 SS5]
MDRHPAYTSLLVEHNLLAEEIRLFVLNSRRYEDLGVAQSLSNRVTYLLSRVIQHNLVIPDDEFTSFRESCNAMLAEILGHSAELRTLPSSADSPHPSSPGRASEPSEPSEPFVHTSRYYAFVDRSSGHILGIFITPDPPSPLSTKWRKEMGQHVMLLGVNLSFMNDDVFSVLQF